MWYSYLLLIDLLPNFKLPKYFQPWPICTWKKYKIWIEYFTKTICKFLRWKEEDGTCRLFLKCWCLMFILSFSNADIISFLINGSQFLQIQVAWKIQEDLTVSPRRVPSAKLIPLWERSRDWIHDGQFTSMLFPNKAKNQWGEKARDLEDGFKLFYSWSN